MLIITSSLMLLMTIFVNCLLRKFEKSWKNFFLLFQGCFWDQFEDELNSFNPNSLTPLWNVHQTLVGWNVIWEAVFPKPYNTLNLNMWHL